MNYPAQKVQGFNRLLDNKKRVMLIKLFFSPELTPNLY